MKFITRLFISAITVFVLSKILSGIHVDNFVTAIIFALSLACLNAIVKPILILLTLPVTLVTLGLFLFVINAALILLADRLVEGIRVDGFWWALLFSIILSVFSSATDTALTSSEK